MCSYFNYTFMHCLTIPRAAVYRFWFSKKNALGTPAKRLNGVEGCFTFFISSLLFKMFIYLI